MKALKMDDHFSVNDKSITSYYVREDNGKSLLCVINKTTWISGIKEMDDIVPDDGPLRSDGPQRDVEEDAFGALMVFMTWLE